MRETGTTIADQSIALDGFHSERRSSVPWIVANVKALPDYELSVVFVDGTCGRIKMRDFIFSEKSGVFTDLRDPAAFQNVFCDEGHVEWANGLDLAPDAMHDRLIAGGGEYTIEP